MIQAVLFDLDGVLVDTDALHFQAWKELADRLNIPFTQEQGNRCRGISRMDSLEIVLEGARRTYTREEKETFAREKNLRYQEMLQSLTPEHTTPGAEDVLKGLHDRGYKLALASGSRNASLILERTGLGRWLDAVADGTLITRSKPDPEVFLVAAHKLELSPRQCLVVEDSAAGIEAAAAGGMKSLGVGPFYRSLHADYEAPLLCEVQNWDEILK